MRLGTALGSFHASNKVSSVKRLFPCRVPIISMAPRSSTIPPLPLRCVSRISDNELDDSVVGVVKAAAIPEARPPVLLDTEYSSASVALARDLIRIESVTPNDNGCQELIKDRLETIGFDCETLQYEDVTNLWAVRGGDPHNNTKPLLVFAGHTDVVPSGPSSLWTFPPFSGTIAEDGMLYGRGAADMKGGIACFVVACERFVQKHPEHGDDFSIGLLLTSDEEGPAKWGTQEVMKELARRGVSIDMCIVGEATSHERCGDTIKVGRRGSLSGTLTVWGTQGHVAYPHLAINPLHLALGPLKELIETEWDKGNDNFPPTTFQISNIAGGTGATNVIPGHKTTHFNFRYSPETSDLELKEKVKSILDGYGIAYDVDWSDPAYPFETKRGDFLNAVRDSVRDVTGHEPELSTSGGTSDGRFIAASGAKVVELGPINKSIHQIDEKVSTADLDTLTDIYLDILERVLIRTHAASEERDGDALEDWVLN